MIQNHDKRGLVEFMYEAGRALVSSGSTIENRYNTNRNSRVEGLGLQ